ncbi:MAG TPA: metalloprotease TldD [Steroidobacteraceae bacterium]|nr:metalloprotease TldD [Steroidobacteraceae bacterium]
MPQSAATRTALHLATPAELAALAADAPIDLAKSVILAPSGLDEGRLEQVLGTVMGHAIDFADVYFQLSREESWALEDGIVKEGSHSIDQGVGVRAIAGEKTGFAYSDEILWPALAEASEAARTIARSGGSGRVQAWRASPQPHRLYLPIDPLAGFSDQDKVALLEKIDVEARRLDPRVSQVMARLAAVHEVILGTASDGTFAADVRPLVRLNVSVIVEHDGRREQGYAGGGGRFAFERLIEGERWRGFVEEAVRSALVNLEAQPAPAGTMTVVLGPGWPGVLLHEAIGHGLEGDFNRKGVSAFSGRIGQQVASPECTVVDDGTLGARRGSLNVDDEGTPTRCTTLIENGVLRGYLQDKLNARLMGVAPTGNGRRESFAHVTMPRMTNTYMLPGPHTHEEIIQSVPKGLYCRNFGGGQVDITSGKFVFSASEAYLIENGRITTPVRGATLIGNGPDVLTRVSMVGNDLKLDDGVGTCGKEGQEVPVGVGQPTLRVDGLTVGGTAT